MNALVPSAHRSNVMLVRLAVIYGKPDSDDPIGFLREYVRAMQPYVESELEAAADRLLASHKYKRWPSIAECIEALEAARKARRTHLLAQQMQQQEAQKGRPKIISPQEQREAEKFVDECADEKIELGFCAGLLRNLAKQMRSRRGRVAL